MIKFKRDKVVYLEKLDRDFIFKRGYSYYGSKIKDGYKVWNIDKSVVVEIVGDGVGEYLEV